MARSSRRSGGGRTVGRPSLTPGYGISKAARGLLPWSYVVEQATASRNYWVCTTRADGRPHATPVWGIWMDDAVYFSCDPASMKGRNLSVRPDVVVHLESGDDTVILEGRVEPFAEPGELKRFADAYEAKYAVRPDTSNPMYGLYRLRPAVVLAWREKDFPKSATRWVARA